MKERLRMENMWTCGHIEKETFNGEERRIELAHHDVAKLVSSNCKFYVK
jgi:hypothetical protein